MMSTPGAAALDATVDLLSRYEGAPIQLERRAMSVVVTPQLPGTFPITIYDEGEEAMISSERWHTHYDDPWQVAFCALWLLTPYYRLVHELKGGVLVSAWLERYEEEGWVAFEPVYFLNPESPQDWIPKPGETYTRRYLQQAILPPPQPYTEFCPGAVLDEDGLPPDFFPGARSEVVDGPLGPSLL